MTTTDTLITIDPEILSGMPVFTGTRVPIKNLWDYLAGGDPLDEFLEDFPSVTREAAIGVLMNAQELLVNNAHLAR